MSENDNLQAFMFDTGHVRGQITHLNKTFTTIINQRSYPPAVRTLLGEAMVSCLLLASSIKFEGELSLQFQGDTRLPLLLVQCDHLKQIRAYAKFQADLSDEEYQQSFLSGKMALTINQYNQNQAYQSVVPIQSTSMAENLTHYFIQSEQIVSQVWLWVGENTAAGVLLQLMPGQSSLERENFWEYALTIGQTVTAEEIFGLSNETLLHRLYHEEQLCLFERQDVFFKCRCTASKMQQVLATIGESECQAILKEQEKIDINCEFCNSHYTFDAIDVAMLFKKQ